MTIVRNNKIRKIVIKDKYKITPLTAPTESIIGRVYCTEYKIIIAAANNGQVTIDNFSKPKKRFPEKNSPNDVPVA